MYVPALVRGAYATLELTALRGFDGTLVADCAVAPPLLVHQAARRYGDMSGLPLADLLDVFRRAGVAFAREAPDDLEPETFVRYACLLSGLPLQVVRERTLGFFPALLTRMERVLRAQCPGDISALDTGVYQAGDVEVALAPRGHRTGFVMPGNHPSTHAIWVAALAMKMPVLLRPSQADIFTPYRLLRALLAAGLPPDAAYLLPGAHDLVSAIVQSTSPVVIFGGQAMLDTYGGDPRIKVYGPGRSKVLVAAGADPEEAVSVICRLVMDDAGRGCINCSAVAVEGDARPLALAVAQRLQAVPTLSPLQAEACLPAAMSAAEARGYDQFIQSRLTGAEDLLYGPRGSRVAMAEAAAVLRPTVILAPSCEHPLYGVELPFPFVVFAPAASRQELLAAARHSLAVTTVGLDAAFLRDLLRTPTVSKVYAGGALSTELDPAQPHEGYLLDFLFERKAFARTAGRA